MSLYFIRIENHLQTTQDPKQNTPYSAFFIKKRSVRNIGLDGSATKVQNPKGKVQNPKGKVQNPRVRARSRGRVICLKNVDSPRQYGVKGAATPCGAWGSAPQKETPKTNYRSRFRRRGGRRGRQRQEVSASLLTGLQKAGFCTQGKGQGAMFEPDDIFVIRAQSRFD